MTTTVDVTHRTYLELLYLTINDMILHKPYKYNNVLITLALTMFASQVHSLLFLTAKSGYFKTLLFKQISKHPTFCEKCSKYLKTTSNNKQSKRSPAHTC